MIVRVDGGDCEVVVARFAEGGVDVDALAARLQEAGTRSLLKVMGTKGALPQGERRCS